MRAILRWEIWQRRWAIFWWALATATLIALLFLLYPSIHSQATQFNKLINELPAGLRNFKNGNSNVDVSTPVGFLNSQVYYITLPIMLIILAISRGSALIGREEQDHTLELLLARPISRGRLILGKALAGISELLIVTTAVTLISLALDTPTKLNLSVERLVLVNLYAMLFSLSFGAIAFALTAAGSLTKRLSTVLAVFIAFGGYILASLSSLTHWLNLPSKFAPYHYFLPENILSGRAVAGLNLYLIGAFVFSIALAYLGFRRRDIE